MSTRKIEIGDYIAGLKVIELIAEGGSATVYKCKNEDLESYKAVKVMKPEEETMAERFITEAKVIANMNNTNIIQVHDVGITNEEQGECPYIEMEYVEGKDLGEFIYRNEIERIPEKASLSLICILTKALNYAHNNKYKIYNKEREGLIHRDIKPANVLISKNGDVKLTDFGLVKVMGLKLHTMTGMTFMGTPYYLSPEQVKNEELDIRSDLYSLGCLFYEILVGKPAFKIDNIGDLVLAKENDEYDKDALKKYACKDIIKVIERMMVSDINKRYQDTQSLKNDLYAILLKFKINDATDYFKEYVKNPNGLQFHAIEKSYKKLTPIVVITICIIGMIASFTYFKFLKETTNTSKPIEKSMVKNDNSFVPKKTLKFEKIEKEENADKKVENKKIINDKKIEKKSSPRVTKKKPTVKPKKIETKKEIITEPKEKEVESFNSFIALYKQNKYIEAKEIISNLNIFSKKDEKYIIEEIKKLMSRGKYKVVENLFNNIRINDAYYHFLIGKNSFLLKKYSNSKKSYNKALSSKTTYLSNNDKMKKVIYELSILNKTRYDLDGVVSYKHDYIKNLNLLISITGDDDYYNKLAKRELKKIQ